MKKKIFIICFICMSMLLIATEGHHHQKMEMGFSLAAVNLSHESEWLGGIHLHMNHRLGAHGLAEKIALGIGLETIFGGDPHLSLMVNATVYPWKGLALTVSPGILLAKEDGIKKKHFVLHLEATYGFELFGIEMGPLFSIAFAGEERHYGIGVHFGHGF